MIVFLILVAGYCYRMHLKTKNWQEDQRYYYFARTWYWTHHPEEFEDDRIHFC